MSKKVNLLATRMASARNIRETQSLSRQSSFKKTQKESSLQKISAEKERSVKLHNEYLKLMIEGTNYYTKEEIFEELLNILKKNQDERNFLDIKFLIFATSTIKFFQKTATELGQKANEKLCNSMSYASFKAGETIFQIGDQGDKFYVILKGKVGVLIKIPKEVTNNYGERQRLFSLTEIAVLNVGDGFGELALLNDAPRLATIICKEDCYFATLDKESFRSILAEHEKEKIMEKINFLQSVPAFSKLRSRTISTLIYHFARREYFKDSIVYKEGDEPRLVYIIKSGQFKISKSLCANSSNKNKNENDFTNRQSLMNSRKKIDIALLGVQEIFGEEEIIYNLKKRNHTISCASLMGEVYIISKEDFYKRIIATHQEGLEIMEAMIKEKKKLHEKLFFKNEHFLKKEMQSNNNEYSIENLASIYPEKNIPYLSQAVAKHRSSCFRGSQMNLDILTQKKLDMNAQPQMNEKNIYETNRNTKKRFYSASAMSDRVHDKNEKTIHPDLSTYFNFLNKKWRDFRIKSKMNEEQEFKEQIKTFMTERRKNKKYFPSNFNLEQKTRVEKDISFVNLNFKQLLNKFLDIKKEDKNNEIYCPKQEITHFNNFLKPKRRNLTFHKIATKNIEFLDDKPSKKEEIMESILSIKKAKINKN